MAGTPESWRRAMNTAGQIGSLVCPILVIRLVKWYGDWNAAVYALLGTCSCLAGVAGA